MGLFLFERLHSLFGKEIVRHTPLIAIVIVEELSARHEKDAPAAQPFVRILFAVRLAKNAKDLFSVLIGIGEPTLARLA